MSKALALLLFSGLASASAPLVLPKGPVAPRPVENNALALALTDIRTLPQAARPAILYLWVKSGDPDEAKCVSHWLNLLSRNAFIVQPLKLTAGRLLLVRADLRHYAPRAEDLQDWLATRELLAFDPCFSLLVTKDTIRLLKGEQRNLTVRQRVRRKITRQEERPRISKKTGKPFSDGRTETVSVQDEEEVDADVPISEVKADVIRLPAEHVDQRLFAQLKAETHSEAPIVTSAYFQRRALTSIKDKGIFKTLYGGQYYEWAGIKKNTTGKGTDEDLWFQDHVGIGNIAAGVTVDKFYDNMQSDMRAILLKSAITGKERLIELGHGPNERTGGGAWSRTGDLQDEDIGIGSSPKFNLRKPKVAAHENLFARATGLQGAALFNRAGALQDEAPFNVVNDRTVPEPHTARLQTPISCISCHQAKPGLDGWQPFDNHMRPLLKYFIGDVSKTLANYDDTARIQGLYRTEPAAVNKWLQRARDDLAAATLQATGPWKESQRAQADVIEITARKTVALFNHHVYDTIDARRALEELGIEVEAEKAVAAFRKFFPPEPQALIDGVVADDVRLLALREGLAIGRNDWDQLYSFAAARLQRALAAKPKP